MCVQLPQRPEEGFRTPGVTGSYDYPVPQRMAKELPSSIKLSNALNCQAIFLAPNHKSLKNNYSLILSLMIKRFVC